MTIAYICRGNGFGHAAHALPIIKELSATLPSGSVEVASAGCGYRYFSQHGHPCVDLGFLDHEDHSREAIAAVLEYLQSRRDQLELVVIDEFFFGPPLCRRLGLPNVFITHIFGHELGNGRWDEFLTLADQIILLDFAPAHQIPKFLDRRVKVAGPVLSVPDGSRIEARKHTDLADNAFVAAATWGASNIADKRNAIVHMLDRVQEAWSSIADVDARPQPTLVLLGEPPSGYDLDVDRPDVVWRPFVDDAIMFYRSADVVFTLGGMSMLESIQCGTRALAFKGLPWEARGIDYLGEMRAVTVIDDRDGADIVRARMLGSDEAGEKPVLAFAEPAMLAAALAARIGKGQRARTS